MVRFLAGGGRYLVKVKLPPDFGTILKGMPQNCPVYSACMRIKNTAMNIKILAGIYIYQLLMINYN